MARIPFVNVGEIGILRDPEPSDLAPNAWSDGRNVRFVNGHVEKMLGHQSVFTPQVNAQFAVPVECPQGYFWLYAGDRDVYAYKDGIHNIATRASSQLNGTSNNDWTGGILNGIAVLNNPNDIPQAWATPGAGNRMVNLPNWNQTWKCRSMRPFLNYLVALGVKKGATDNPWLVHWSHVADPGTVPSSWDETNPKVDAGSMVLADTNGYLVDQWPLGRNNIIYKTDSVYAMQHVGGIDIMAFPPVAKAGGLLCANGVVGFSWRGDHHAVIGPNEVYVHSGNNAEPVLHKRVRDWMYNTISQDFSSMAFACHNEPYKEIWFCFPQAGANYANIAVVWNYRDDTTTIKEIPSTTFMASGKILSLEGASTSDTWDNAAGSWDSDTDKWGYSAYTTKYARLLSFTPGGGRKAYMQDVSVKYGTEVYESYVERVGLSALGKDPMTGKPIYDTDQVKIVTEVWPRIKAEAGAEIEVTLGTQEAQDKPIRWTAPYKYIAGTTKKINTYVGGKILSIRFGAKAGVFWELSGYDLEIVSGGRN